MAFGINARFILLIVWGISAACIGLAGVMIANFGALSTLSSIVGLRAIPVVLIGGMDSIGGALVGGIIVGVCEALAGAYIDPLGLVGFKDVAPYILLLIVLFIRPYGLFGTVRIERV
jgi:branched-chain amino acid transport system permease protein